MRISRALLFLAPFSLLSSGASAQVLISEVQSDPISPSDDEEWIEIQNAGTASVSLEGWSFNDWVGATDPANESDTRWTFPAGASLAAGEVIVVARQATLFAVSLGVVASWELADGIDDPLVPNMTPVGGTTPIQLANSADGDAVVLRDDLDAIVSYCEWGMFDRSLPGTPFSADPPAGSSLIRIGVTGVSANDFTIANTPTPFVGFMSTQTAIVGTVAAPRHVLFGDTYNVSTMVTDADGVNAVEIYFATATSSAGNAVQNYVASTMTSTGSTYSFMDQVENLGPGFVEPDNFHSRYVRFFILAEDLNFDTTSEPPNADEGAANPFYLPTYLQNVLPTDPTQIADAREPAAEDMPMWSGHSVRVQGIALIEADVMDPQRTLFTIQDNSNAAIGYFSTSTVTPDFSVGDELVITGVIGTFRGFTQLTEGQIEVTGASAPVPESNVTLAELLANGEQYEGELVKIDDLDFVDARTNWPDDPNDLGSWNVQATDGTNEIQLRVTSTTDLFGQAAPQYGFDIRGVLNERDGVLQLFPRGVADVSAHPMPPPPDAGMPDAVVGADSGPRPDAGTGGTDTGTGGAGPDEGCGCAVARHTSSGSALSLILLGLLVFVRRRLRTSCPPAAFTPSWGSRR